MIEKLPIGEWWLMKKIIVLPLKESRLFSVRKSLQALCCVVGFVLFPSGTTIGATFSQDFQIDPQTSSLSCTGTCASSLSYQIAGTFRMVVDDNLGYANMSLAAIDVTTPVLPDGPFQFPGYWGRYENPAFYGTDDACAWPFSGFCMSLPGGSSSYSGSFNGTNLSMTGSQVLIFTGHSIDSTYYTYAINASTVPLPAAFWLFGSGLAGLFGFSRCRKAF